MGLCVQSQRSPILYEGEVEQLGAKLSPTNWHLSTVFKALKGSDEGPRGEAAFISRSLPDFVSACFLILSSFGMAPIGIYLQYSKTLKGSDEGPRAEAAFISRSPPGFVSACFPTLRSFGRARLATGAQQRELQSPWRMEMD